MYYESNPRALHWITGALEHPVRRVRLDAVNLLSVVDCAPRASLLGRALRDRDPIVAATAAFVDALTPSAHGPRFDLFESDFGADLAASDLEWEWEYALAVCDGFVFPGVLTNVWTAFEDDDAARCLAVMKCYAGKMDQSVRATPLIVDKRLVTIHTRKPRSRAEAHRWHLNGRPRYRDT